MSAQRLFLGLSLVVSPFKKSLAAVSHALIACSLLTACASSSAPSTRNGSRDLQLIRAAERGHTQEMFRLIKAGADINAQDAEGWTPYLAASSMGHFEAMRMLRAFGARTEAPEMAPEPTAHRYIRP